jgi:hypothetical protein
MTSGIEIGFLLDRLWHQLRGEMEQSKRPALLAIAQILADAAVPYAVIGGIAMQVHQREPRTTLDIDLAVLDRASIPAERLLAARFVRTGDHPHSENWRAADGTPVQFTDDPLLGEAIRRAKVVDLGGLPLRVIAPADLLHAKLRAGADPARRRSKRLQDFADAQGLLEADPALAAGLTAPERALLGRLPP